MINADKIITISLKENHARQHSVKNELAKLNLQTEFYLAERDHENPQRGCFNSHVSVCQQALDEGCHSLLLFQDDVKILSFQKSQLDQVNDFLQNQTRHPFDILYLGLIIRKMFYCGYPSIVRARGPGLHALILSRQGMEKMSSLVYERTPLDITVMRHFYCYSIYPIIAEQFPEDIFPSDLEPYRISQERDTCKNGKDSHFWERNYKKQKRMLWRHFFSTVKYFLK